MPLPRAERPVRIKIFEVRSPQGDNEELCEDLCEQAVNTWLSDHGIVLDDILSITCQHDEQTGLAGHVNIFTIVYLNGTK